MAPGGAGRVARVDGGAAVAGWRLDDQNLTVGAFRHRVAWAAAALVMAGVAAQPPRLAGVDRLEAVPCRAVSRGLTLEDVDRGEAAADNRRVGPGPLDDGAQLADRVDMAYQHAAAVARLPPHVVTPPPHPPHGASLFERQF